MAWPDWRKPEEYPDPDLAPPDRWAWEFLRRNPEYQADFQRLGEDGGYYCIPMGANPIPYPELGLKVPMTAEEEEAAFMALFEGGKSLVGDLEFKWGVKPIASPDAEDAWKYWQVRPAFISPYKPADFGRELRITDKDGWRWRVKATEAHAELDGNRWGFRAELKGSELLVRLDAAGPIEDQLKTAEWLLKLYRGRMKIKPYGSKARPELWPRYLRILDARNEPKRPGWGAIASVFASEGPDSDWTERRARETHKAALALADRGWRFIASRHPDLEEPRQKKKARRPAK